MAKAAASPSATDLPVSFDDIRAAAARIEGKVERTPLRPSRTLSEITGAEVWIKFENLQFTASFKERGAYNKLAQLTEAERKAGVIAISAGNHAQGVAYNAARLGVPSTIVMPRTTPFVKVEHTRKHGARVVLHGESMSEAFEHGYALAERERLTLVHPFDDAAIIAGQGTIALEMLADEPSLDTLVIPVGGGGLISGNAIAAKHLKPGIEIVGVEAAMYPGLYSELRGEPIRVGGQTIAEGIAVKQAGRLNFQICKALVDDVLLVEEAQLEEAVALYANVEKTVAEGAGAAGLAALLAHPARFKGRRCGLILCGGNIDSRLLASVLVRELVREGRIARVRLIGDDQPGLLSRVSKVIGELGGNIIEVAHNRLVLDIPAKGAEIDFTIETRDLAHTREIVEGLKGAGYPVQLLPFEAATA
ncbi:MAG: threonine ammonia-lyase [Hydrogenophilaceae bacterium]|jgi:threonine dehydratase|nr:threonine ammonia-lyase [Hydrogenophilaceae bacterium]